MRTQEWAEMFESSDLAICHCLLIFWLVEFPVIIMQHPSHAETFLINVVYMCIVIHCFVVCGTNHLSLISFSVLYNTKANKKVSCKNIHKCRDGAASP